MWYKTQFNTSLNNTFLKRRVCDSMFAIYVLQVVFDGQKMTKLGIVRSGTLRERFKSHLKKKYYSKVKVLCVLTLRPSCRSYRYLCSSIVSRTESNYLSQLKSEGLIKPTPIPGKQGVSEVEVVARDNERRALEVIDKYTTSNETQSIAKRFSL